TPFDLQRGPLLRTTLLQLDDTAWVALVTLHHIIADGWSIGLLIRDLAQLYAALAHDLPSSLPPLPVQYADFAAWQRHALSDQRLQLLLTAWTDQLHGAPTTLELPTDHPRPPVQSVLGATLPVRLPRPLTQALLALSQQHGVTLFMTLLAAFQVLLSRSSGQDELLVGSPIAGRTRAELDEVIGCFVNTLVLRADLRGQPSFLALLERVRTTTLHAYEHQELPFERLVEALQPARDLSRSPLVQVMFALHNTPQEAIALPGLTLTRLAVDSGTAKFDLALSLNETADGLVGTLEYATALFERATMERLIDHFHTLLAAIVADPQQAITTLPLLTDAEQHQLLVDWNTTSLPYPQDQCLHQLLEAQVARTPEAIALQCGDAVLTYGELNARANQLAYHLQKLGVGPDVRVGLCLDRSLDLVVGLLGILKAGGAYVPIDPSYPAERIAFLLADAQLGALVTQAALSVTLPPFAGVTVRLDQDAEAIAQQPTTNPHAAVAPQDLAYVIYTSGSTGRPKGVLVEHRQVVNTLWGSRQRFGFAAADMLPWLASVAFDIAVFELFSPLLVGGTTLIVRREEILDLPRLSVLLQRCTLLHAVPALLRQIVQQADAPYPHMRRVFVGGEAVPPDLLAALPEVFPEAQIEVLYGPTETAILCTHYAVPSDTAVTGHPIGRPLPNHQIRLYDRHSQIVPIGVAGEIYVGGAGVTRGYLKRAELTAEKFITIDGERWYRTGDLARWRHDGTLEFLGRIDHQVKIRGFRIELGEIEAVLGQHPGVNECVIVVREDRPGDKQLVAYVVENQEPRTKNQEPRRTEQANNGTSEQRGANLPPRLPQPTPASASVRGRGQGGEGLPSTLRQHLKERLPDYMIPAAFVTLPALPKTLTGKLDRAALPVPELHPAIDDTFQAPTSPVEELLVSIWAEVLGVQRVSTRANFFALGGHSLLATQLVSRIRSALAVELPLRQIFAAPTVAELAQHIATLRAGDQAQPDASPIQPGDRTGPLPLSFSQERLWFLDQLEPNSPLYSIPFMLRVSGR
ncbi:MAG TPA: amino acid adenylation domain-containing protein, partial [Herpetosiphonaceae bacterium]